MQQHAHPSRFFLQPAPPRATLGARRWIFGLAAALCFTPLFTPPLALALGMVLTLTLELRRRGLKRGLATACIGGGQGIAALVETI